MEFCKDSDRTHIISVKSRLLGLYWRQDLAEAHGKIALQIHSLYTGNGSIAKLSVFDSRQHRVYSAKVALNGSLTEVEFTLTKTAREFIVAEVALSNNGNSLRSSALPLLTTRALIFGQSWQPRRFERQQTLHYSAQCRGIDDEETVAVDILLHGHNGVDQLVCGFNAAVRNQQIQQDWCFDGSLPTQNLPFPYRGTQQYTYQVPLIYANAHAHQLTFQQARDDYLSFEHDECAIRLSPKSLHQCRANLYSSDGKCRELLLNRDSKLILSISPGPCLLILSLDHRKLLDCADACKDQSFDRLNLPSHLKLPQALDYVPAPLPDSPWSAALHYQPRAFTQDLLQTASSDSVNKHNCYRFRPSDGLLAIKPKPGTGKTPATWHYYRLMHNLLLPINAIDATGNAYLAPAIAYVDNQGTIAPFYLAGKREGYRFALYRANDRENERRNLLAIWSSSGISIDIEIPLSRIALAIKRLSNRERHTNV